MNKHTVQMASVYIHFYCTCAVAETSKLKATTLIIKAIQLWNIILNTRWFQFASELHLLQPGVKMSIYHLVIPPGNITYHDIIAFYQKLSVKGPRNFKCLRDFPGGNLNLRAMRKEHTDTIFMRLSWTVSCHNISIYTNGRAIVLHNVHCGLNAHSVWVKLLFFPWNINWVIKKKDSIIG